MYMDPQLIVKLRQWLETHQKPAPEPLLKAYDRRDNLLRAIMRK